MVALEDRAVAALALGRPRHGRRRARGADRGAPAARAAVGAARARAGPLRPAGRRARGAAPGARRCSPRSSAWSPAPSCAPCRPRCCARTRPSTGSPAGRRRPRGRRRPQHRPRRRERSAAVATLWRPGRWSAGTTSSRRSSAALERAPRPARRAFAALTGDPGIGKSRLCAELAAWPRARGVDRAGRPLLPGRRRAAAVAVAAGARAARRGAARRRDRRRTSGAAVPRLGAGPARCSTRPRDQPLLVVLDDLHWADTSTLRVLRLLAETADRRAGCWCRRPGARTRRRPARWPRSPRRWPAGTPAARAERAHRGRGRRDRSTAVAETAPTDDGGRRAAPPHRRQPVLPRRVRPAGPRAAATSAALVAEEHPPAAVQDVLDPAARRSCPTRPRDAAGGQRDRPRVRPGDARGRGRRRRGRRARPPRPGAGGRAGARGRRRPVPVRPRAGPRHGLRRPRAQSRRARMHARVAEVLGGPPGRRDRGRPALAGRRPGARRAGLARPRTAAAEVARRRLRVRRGAELLDAALDALAEDPAATPRTRSRCCIDLADALPLGRRLGRSCATVRRGDRGGRRDRRRRTCWPGAGELDHQRRLWQSAPHGEVDEVVVARCAAASTGCRAEDGALRCRVMLGLASEIYYGATLEERRGAGRGGRWRWPAGSATRTLLLDACRSAFVVALAPEHRAAAARARRARRSSSPASSATSGPPSVAGTLRAVALGELGRRRTRCGRPSRRPARRPSGSGMLYAQLVLDGLELPVAGDARPVRRVRGS